MTDHEEELAVDLGFSPRIRRERLAAELKALRVEAKLSAAQLAAKVGCSQSRITRLEKLQTLPDLGLVLDILDALGIHEPATRERLSTLARDGSKRGWWRAFSGMPADQAGRADLESGSLRIREYTPVYVPGLLQTPDYALVRFADRDAYDEFNQDEALLGRQKRQEVLHRTSPAPVEYEAVLDESVFRRRTAPPEVMAGQLEHLVELAQLANVTLRVLAFEANPERASWPLNPFSLHEFFDPTDPKIVSVETESSELQLGDDEDLARYTVVYERIRAAALDPDDSITFIKGVRP